LWNTAIAEAEASAAARNTSRGCATLDTSVAHPREVFRAAALASASAIAVFHNHPSGDPRPSQDDMTITHQIVAAGQIMGIDVVDHVILGDGCWFSFRQAEMW